MSPASRGVPKNLVENHPLPWAVIPEKYNDMGGIKDANGDWVIYLGDSENYYPTSGYAEDEVLNVLTLLINTKGVP
jgi:hypothetical protein